MIEPLLAQHPNAKFVVGDVKHFFMSGKPVQMANCVSKSGESATESDMLYHAVWVLCEHQYVVNKAFKSRVWHVLNGTGMGRGHSGEVADVAFFHDVEQTTCSEESLQNASVLGYWRFKDDILALVAEVPLAVQWIQSMKRASTF